jgi:hypothetical protein
MNQRKAFLGWAVRSVLAGGVIAVFMTAPMTANAFIHEIVAAYCSGGDRGVIGADGFLEPPGVIPTGPNASGKFAQPVNAIGILDPFPIFGDKPAAKFPEGTSVFGLEASDSDHPSAAHCVNLPFPAIQPNGQSSDGQTSVVYNAGTGEVAVDAPAGVELTSINIDSAAAIFTGEPAQNLGGSFDNDADNNIFKATFGSSFGSLTFGSVAPAGLSEEFVVGDLSVIGSLAGGGELGDVDLVYVPEPSTLWTLAFGMLLGLRCVRVNGQFDRR